MLCAFFLVMLAALITPHPATDNYSGSPAYNQEYEQEYVPSENKYETERDTSSRDAAKTQICIAQCNSRYEQCMANANSTDPRYKTTKNFKQRECAKNQNNCLRGC